MTNKFNLQNYLKTFAEELTSGFKNSSFATTPGLKGGVRENLLRKKLQDILPLSIGVGSGCVIDAMGNVSKQQDIILYENQISSKFSIQNHSEATYFPCESVIAVGEIKSKIGKKEIIDSLEKIKSVKELKRTQVFSKNISGQKIALFRSYNSSIDIAGTPDEQYSQDNFLSDQIYGFILCADFSIKNDTAENHLRDQLSKIDINFRPNIFITLNKFVFDSRKINKIQLAENMHSFQYLLQRLFNIIRTGRTTGIKSIENYFL